MVQELWVNQGVVQLVRALAPIVGPFPSSLVGFTKDGVIKVQRPIASMNAQGKITWSATDASFFTTFILDQLKQYLDTHNLPVANTRLRVVNEVSAACLVYCEPTVMYLEKDAGRIQSTPQPIVWFAPATDYNDAFKSTVQSLLQQQPVILNPRIRNNDKREVRQFRGGPNGFTFRVGRGLGGGYGILALAAWCTIARQVRSNDDTFQKWTTLCGATLYQGRQRDGAYRGWSLERQHLPNFGLAVGTIMKEHLVYLASITVTNSDNPTPPVSAFQPVLAADYRNDVPFEDLYRMLRGQADVFRERTLVMSDLVFVMLQQTFMNKDFVIRRDVKTGSCGILRKGTLGTDGTSQKGTLNTKTSRLPIYRFLGYEDVEESRSLVDLQQDFTLVKDFHVPTTDAKTEFYRYHKDYRTRELQYRGMHALWSWDRGVEEKQGKKLQAKTVICGGLSQFVNNKCKGAELTLKSTQGTQWALVPKVDSVAHEKEVFIRYVEQAADLTELLGGACECGTCGKAINGGKRENDHEYQDFTQADILKSMSSNRPKDQSYRPSSKKDINVGRRTPPPRQQKTKVKEGQYAEFGDDTT